MFERYHPSRLRQDRPEAVRVALAFALLAAAGAWASLVSAALADVISSIEGPATFLLGVSVYYLLGYALLAAGFVRVVGLDAPLGFPDSARVPTMLAAWAVPVGLVVTISLVGNVAVGVSVSELTGESMAPSVALWNLLVFSGVPALVQALGTGILLFLAVQTSLREATSPAHAVGLTALAALVLEVYPLSPTPTPTGFRPGALVLFAVAAIFAVALGLAVGLAYRVVVLEGDSLAALRESPYVPLVALGGVGGALLVAGLAEFPDAVMDPAWAIVVATGALVAERTRSVWPGVATLFVYEFALSVTVYVEAVLGLAPLP